jgi:hypothetical protein
MNVVLFLSRVQPDEVAAKTNDKGKHSPPGAGNIYVKANEVIVKITGDDTAQTFEVVEENCKPEQLMNAELTKQLALAHDTVMIEQSKDGRGKGTILG